jgi:hypothetical protein
MNPMKSKAAHSLIVSLILTVGYLSPAQAVSDAELEALEKQIEQQESEEKKQAKAEEKKKAEEKRKAEAEKKQLIELEQKRIEEEKRKKEESRPAELEQQRQEEEAKKKANEQQRLLELEKKRLEKEGKRIALEKEKLLEEKHMEEQHQLRKRIVQAILGKWQTDFGVLIFYEISDEQIGGNYSGLFVNDGTIIGNLEEDRLSGYWFQNSSARGCSKEHNGYAYWGHFVYQFQHKYREFKGKWGYCDEEKTNKWNGKKSE